MALVLNLPLHSLCCILHLSDVDVVGKIRTLAEMEEKLRVASSNARAERAAPRARVWVLFELLEGGLYNIGSNIECSGTTLKVKIR